MAPYYHVLTISSQYMLLHGYPEDLKLILKIYSPYPGELYETNKQSKPGFVFRVGLFMLSKGCDNQSKIISKTTCF